METTAREIKPKSTRSRWAAIWIEDGVTILAEGVKPETVIRKAKKTGKEYSMMFLPDPNTTYIL